eukprot:5662976-Pyramimonas_sp.AAC.1
MLKLLKHWLSGARHNKGWVNRPQLYIIHMLSSMQLWKKKRMSRTQCTRSLWRATCTITRATTASIQPRS